MLATKTEKKSGTHGFCMLLENNDSITKRYIMYQLKYIKRKIK